MELLCAILTEEKCQEAASTVHPKVPLIQGSQDIPASPMQSLPTCQGQKEAGATCPSVTLPNLVVP